MNNKTVAIVGVGLMGHGIALNIQSNNWPINILQHAGNQPVSDLVDNGAKLYETAADLASNSDVIIICVTGSPQVESVLIGKNGLLSNINKGTVIIDCSTAIPASTVQIAELVQNAGAKFLDAPMTRTPKEAAEGRLNLIVGGDKNLYEQQLPLLKSFAENITYAGGVGAGHTMKLLHNYVSLGFSTILAEAAAAANQSGIDPSILHEVLANGGGASVVLDRMAPFILEQDVGSFVFTLSNSAKDLAYYTQMCKDLDANSEVAEVVSNLLTKQVENGNGGEFVPELVRLLRK